MRVVELIERKRDGGKLNADEIDALVQGYTKGDIPDYQMSAFCMAVVWRGMDAKETAALTASMVRSGSDSTSRGSVGSSTNTPPGASATRPRSSSLRSSPRAACPSPR